MVDATRGTVNGTVLVAVGEGLLIGVGYLVAGVPNAALFTIFTVAFAMLPFGAWLAFTVASVVLLSGGGSRICRRCCVWLGCTRHACWRPFRVADPGRWLGRGFLFLLAFVGIFGASPPSA